MEMFSELTALLEEVAELDARIASTPDLPLAHLAPRYAALAKHELEINLTELTANEINDVHAFNILRRKVIKSRVDVLGKIAETTTRKSVIDAIHANDTALVALLIESGEDLTQQAFPVACEKGHVDIVRMLLDLPVDRGVNPGANNSVALKHACVKGHTEIVRLLLDLPVERGVNPGAFDNAALQRACENGHTTIVRLLLELPLERGVNPGANDNAAMYYACGNGFVDIVRLLLDVGVKLECEDDETNSALSIACME